MVTGAVPDQHRLHVGCERCRELGEKQIHDARIQSRRDKPFGLPRLGTRRGQDINVSVLRLPHGTGSRTRSGPDASQRTLLAEPRFVFVKDLQPSVGIVRLDLREALAKFFLNSFCAAGSVWGCCGLGTSDE